MSAIKLNVFTFYNQIKNWVWNLYPLILSLMDWLSAFTGGTMTKKFGVISEINQLETVTGRIDQ